MGKTKCEKYAESLLERFRSWDGEIGVYCNSCSFVLCEHHHSHFKNNPNYAVNSLNAKKEK